MSDPFLRPGEPDSKHGREVLASFVGHRDADTAPSEIARQQQADMHAFCHLFTPMTQYLAATENLTMQEVRYRALERMANPMVE